MNERKPAFINVGGSSIVMLFSVLCLTVFAVLSLISSNSHARLATRAANSVKAYYEADLRAAEIYDEIRDGNYQNVDEVFEYGESAYYIYDVVIDEIQSIAVIIDKTDGEYKIISWNVYSTADWVADENLNVWDGN